MICFLGFFLSKSPSQGEAVNFTRKEMAERADATEYEQSTSAPRDRLHFSKYSSVYEAAVRTHTPTQAQTPVAEPSQEFIFYIIIEGSFKMDYS